MTYDPSNDDDAALVARVRAGDPTAFAAIHARYRQPLQAFAAAQLGSRRDEAEDVVQDAFVRAYRALTADDRPVHLRAWLHTIVRHRVIDELRRPPRVSADDVEWTAVQAGDPAAAAIAREELSAIVADLAALPPRQRAALVSAALDGEPHEHVAERLGTTVAGSKNLVKRARVSLGASRQSRRSGTCHEQ